VFDPAEKRMREVDHVKPLKRAGADAPSNMQWQTTAAVKAKDKTE
jgi:hypothetical protein